MKRVKLVGYPLGVSGLLLAACGGGGVSTGPDGGGTNQGPPPSPPPPSSRSPAVHFGINHSVHGRGWLAEDAFDFETGDYYESYYLISPDAKVLMDGDPLSASDLVVPEGEVVLMSGAQNNPFSALSADHVAITHLLDAPVEAIDPEHSRVTVLGQTVLINSLSCYQISCTAPGTAPAVGDRILVSGYLMGTPGQMLATRLVPSAASGDYLITGTVQALDSAHERFSFGALTINYAQAALHDFSAGVPQEADQVIVRGSRAAGATEFSASSLTHLQPSLSLPSGARAQLYGLVSSLDTSSLTVNGHPVTLTAAAAANCSLPLALNQEVSVSGTVGEDGAVVADVACATQANPVGESITGTVESIDSTFGTLSILGFHLQPSSATLLVNVATRADIQVGDRVFAGVAPGAVTNAWSTWRIEKVPAVSAAELYLAQDEVTVARPSLMVGGRPIATDANTTFTRDGTVIGADEFFVQGWRSARYPACAPPKLRIAVSQSALGALTALSIDVTTGFC